MTVKKIKTKKINKNFKLRALLNKIKNLKEKEKLKKKKVKFQQKRNKNRKKSRKKKKIQKMSRMLPYLKKENGTKIYLMFMKNVRYIRANLMTQIRFVVKDAQIEK